MFSVELPQAEARAAEPAVATTSASGRIAGLTVLCVDNEPAVLRGMQALLEGWDCRAVMAKAAEAIERVGESGRPDIILADYHLDEGTGVEAVAAVRAAAGSSAPVIIITADHSAEVQREVRERGSRLLRKPVKAAALRALMYQLTWRRAVAAE